MAQDNEVRGDAIGSDACRIVATDSITGIDEADWKALVTATTAAIVAADPDDAAHGRGGLPFIDWRYLEALEAAGCVGAGSGWDPRYLLVERDGALVAAAPLFRKHHSYGEYVFDWAWANAYREHGLAYYPKGLVASPFTPVPGPRLLAVDADARERLLDGLVALARQEGWSSQHLLFAPRVDAEAALHHGWQSAGHYADGKNIRSRRYRGEMGP